MEASPSAHSPVPEYVTPSRRSGFATASLVVAIISLLFAFPAGPFGGAAAIICGLVALRRIKESQGRLCGKGFALWGMSLGLSAFLLSGLIGYALLLPRIDRASEAARRASCQNNLMQLGRVLQMYAKDSPGYVYPELLSKSGQLMFAASEVYPKYVNESMFVPKLFACPSDAKVMPWAREDGADPKRIIEQGSYVYLGYVVTTDDEMAAFADAYRLRISKGLPFNEDLDAPPGRGSMGTDKFYRLRDGVERHFAKEKQDDVSIARLQSKIPVMWDTMWAGTNIAMFNHVPGGANVLFMDGHVEFQKYPGPFPASKQGLEALSKLMPALAPALQ